MDAIGLAKSLLKLLQSDPNALSKADKPKEINHIKNADDRIKPLMQNIQSSFTNIKKQIEEAGKNPNSIEFQQLRGKFRVKVKTKKNALGQDTNEFELDKKTGLPIIHADNNAIMNHVVQEEFKKDPSKFIPRITLDNSKLENEAIAAWTTPAIYSCPGARDCKNWCFADSDQIQYKNAAAKRFVNLYAAKNHDFESHINNQLQQMRKLKGVTVKDWDKITGHKIGKKKGKDTQVPIYGQATDEQGNPVTRNWNTFRLHDSGDFHNPEYVDKWHNIVKSNPDIRFYAYTKSYSSPAIWDKLKALHQLPNMKIIQSMGGEDHMIDPDMPHSVIFETADQANKAGYVDSHNFDSRASDKKNNNVGLVIFGKKGRYGSLGKHLSKAPQIIERLKGKLDDKELSHDSELDAPTKLMAADKAGKMNKNENHMFKDEFLFVDADSDEGHKVFQSDHDYQKKIANDHHNTLHPSRKLKRKLGT